MPTLQDEERDEFRSPTQGASKYLEWARRVTKQYETIEESAVAAGDFAQANYWRSLRKDHEAEVKEAMRRYGGV